jgi:hypothetical protein
MSMQVVIDKITKNVDESVYKLTLDLDKSIVMGTPVGDPTYWKYPPPPGYVGGRARGNWQPSVGEPITTEIDRIDASGNSVMADIEQVVPKKAGSVVWLSNNVHYIRDLETGYSKRQAPQGMVRLNFQRITSVFR